MHSMQRETWEHTVCRCSRNSPVMGSSVGDCLPTLMRQAEREREREMVNLYEIETGARQLLEHHGLASQGWTFRWDRSKKRAGACRHTSKVISLSRPIFSIEENQREAVETILHEIAHALVGPAENHGVKWQRKAIELGIAPNRCHALEIPELPIVGECHCPPGTHTMGRMPSRTYRCNKCGSLIRWVRREKKERKKERVKLEI